MLHTGAGDAEAKGAIERWHRTWREEVEDELDEGRVYPISELSEIHEAWLSEVYERRVHDTTKREPFEHWLEQAEHLRPVPAGKRLDEVFLHRAWRTVRRDGTVRFFGKLLEVRAELSGKVELRFDPTNEGALPRVFVNDEFYCDTVVLDRIRNATRKRRRELGAPEPSAEPSGLDPLGTTVRDYRKRTGTEKDSKREQAFRRAAHSDDELDELESDTPQPKEPRPCTESDSD